MPRLSSVVIASPFEVTAATTSATCFGKCSGIIDHAEEQQCAQCMTSVPCSATERTRCHRTVAFGGFIRADSSRHSSTMFSKHGILEQAVHFGMYITGVFVGFFLKLFRAFLNGIHILFEVGKLSVGSL